MAFENPSIAAGFPMARVLSCLLEDIASLTEAAGHAPETEVVAFRWPRQKAHRFCQRRCLEYWISCATLPRLGLDHASQSSATWDVVMTNRVCRAPDGGWEPICYSLSWLWVVLGSLARLLQRRLVLAVGHTSCHQMAIFPRPSRTWIRPWWALLQKWWARCQRQQ
jgi:hypothetical protein